MRPAARCLRRLLVLHSKFVGNSRNHLWHWINRVPSYSALTIGAGLPSLTSTCQHGLRGANMTQPAAVTTQGVDDDSVEVAALKSDHRAGHRPAGTNSSPVVGGVLNGEKNSRCRCGFGADRAGVCQRVGKPRPIGSPNNSSASARCSAVLSKRSRPVLNVGPRQIRSGTGGCAGHTCAAEPDLGRGGL